MPTKAILEEQLAEARAALTDLQGKVKDEVARVAETQGWCEDGQRETLRRLGLGHPVRARVTVTYVLEGTPKKAPDGDDDFRKTNVNWIGASIIDLDEAKMDNDWEADFVLEHENTEVELLGPDDE